MKDNYNPNEQSSASQAKRILAYMKAGNRITPIEALNLFGCFRLGARIADLKDGGRFILDNDLAGDYNLDFRVAN